MVNMGVIKKIVFIFMAAIAIFTIIGCEEPVDRTNTRQFWAQNIATTPNTFYQLDAEKLAENSRCEVWAEVGSGVTEATANSIANEYANTIYTKMMNTFGYQVNDQDLGRVDTMQIAHYLATGYTSGAKLTILLLNIKDGYATAGDPYVAGYFYAMDLIGNDPSYPQYKSNELDMIYLDTYPSVLGSSSSYETLAHEMQHLMNFISSIVFRFEDDELNLMDTWIDEGLSSAAEWIYSGKDSEGRCEYYNEDKSGLISKGNNFYMWDNRGSESKYANLDDYATVYLFFQWLRLQSGGTDIYRDIHTSEFFDYKAVTNGAKSKIENIYNNNWSLLLRDWHAANYANAASGRYGYRNDATLKDIKAPMVSGGTTSLNLFPGEGVYSKTSTSDALPSASNYIKYAGLSASGAPSDSNRFANGAQLTYNVDTNINGTSEAGYTTGIAPSPSVAVSIPGSRSSVQIGSNKFTGTFKVDASYFRGRNGSRGIPDNEIRSLINKSDNSRSINNSNNTLKFDLTTVERVFY
jgi:hypothetical protein